MEFQIGDKIVLKDNIFKAYLRTTKVKHTNSPKEVIESSTSSSVKIRKDNGTTKTVYKTNYRLATESEIKMANIKKLFINKNLYEI
mgnify:FL=1